MFFPEIGIWSGGGLEEMSVRLRKTIVFAIMLFRLRETPTFGRDTAATATAATTTNGPY